MDDLISRQAAIEAVMNHYRVGDKPQNEEMDWCAKMLHELPSAEKKGEWIPVVDGNYIIWECSECHVESEAWTDFCPICGSRNIEETDEEAYEEALEKFLQNPKTYTLDEVENELGLTAEKKGKWIDYCGGVKCDQCGFECDDPYYLDEANFCPNCGAKMMEDDMR